MKVKDKIPLECLDVVRRFNTYGLNIKSNTDLESLFYTIKKDRRFKRWCDQNHYNITEHTSESELAYIVSRFRKHVYKDLQALTQFILGDNYNPHDLDEVYFDSLSKEQIDFIFACYEVREEAWR